METLPATRLLIVDCDADYLVRLAGVLVRAGHEVEACSGVDEALAAARRARVALAIVDPAACGGRGLELARQLRDAQGVPFICLFSGGRGEQAGRAAALGGLAFLAKPSDPALCLPTVTVALALAEARAAERGAAHESIAGLERALGESRAIGFAVGLLMERLRMDRRQAFAALREEARARRQRIGDVAESLLGAAELINGLQEQEPIAAQLLAS